MFVVMSLNVMYTALGTYTFVVIVLFNTHITLLWNNYALFLTNDSAILSCH